MSTYDEVIETARLRIRPYRQGDELEILQFISENRLRLRAVLSSWALEMCDVEDARRFIKRMWLGWISGKLFLFGFWDKAGGALAGEVMLFNVRAPDASVEVGYYVAQRYEGRGLVAEAVRSCISFAGARLGVKSFRANCAKDNVRSRMTAARCGFVVVAEDAEGVRYEFSPPGPDVGAGVRDAGV